MNYLAIVYRDFTINALFYNLNSGIVEDFTGFGCQDLHDGNLLLLLY